MRLRIVASIVAASLFLLRPGYTNAETMRITIDNLEYAPSSLDARVGDTVEWLNRDSFTHTATAKGEWDVTLAPAERARVVLKKAGTVEYFCRFHPNMKGRIVVRGK